MLSGKSGTAGGLDIGADPKAFGRGDRVLCGDQRVIDCQQKIPGARPAGTASGSSEGIRHIAESVFRKDEGNFRFPAGVHDFRLFGLREVDVQ